MRRTGSCSYRGAAITNYMEAIDKRTTLGRRVTAIMAANIQLCINTFHIVSMKHTCDSGIITGYPLLAQQINVMQFIYLN